MAAIQGNTDEQRLREAAYLIWEEAGRPFGQEDLHWQMAKEISGRTEVAVQQFAAPAIAPSKKRAVVKPAVSSVKASRKNASDRQSASPVVYQ